MTRLITKRLILRAAREDDLAPLHAIYSDPRAMAYWSTPPHCDMAETRAWMQNLLKPGPRTYFVLDYQGVAIGTGGVHAGTEIGFMLQPEHWRQGLMREAVQAIIAHVWANTDWPEITADTDPRNAASIGFLTSLGFWETGRAENTFCVDSVWSDSIYFALPRPKEESAFTAGY